ncbi:MAG TPA: hypothetical protein VF462_00675 [Micromonosporaceae bacterium]
MLLDLVPVARRVDRVRHALTALVEPGGRLLVSHYQSPGGTDVDAGQHLRQLGLTVTVGGGADRAATTAWIDQPGPR